MTAHDECLMVRALDVLIETARRTNRLADWNAYFRARRIADRELGADRVREWWEDDGGTRETAAAGFGVGEGGAA